MFPGWSPQDWSPRAGGTPESAGPRRALAWGSHLWLLNHQKTTQCLWYPQTLGTELSPGTSAMVLAWEMGALAAPNPSC